jgi:flagellar motor switch protein FliN/FliY
MNDAIDTTNLSAMNDADIEAWRDFMDLSVPLSVELGRTQMTTRALLEIEAQGIIQLSRSTGEGVDVLAGERRIARGEILMIEDRTGIRINEIILPEEK